MFIELSFRNSPKAWRAVAAWFKRGRGMTFLAELFSLAKCPGNKHLAPSGALSFSNF
jgi:hypothetical protein